MASHLQALLPVLKQFIKQGCLIDIIIDESCQMLLKNLAGINQVFLHSTFMTEKMQLHFKLQTSKKIEQGVSDKVTLSFVYKLLLAISIKATPILKKLNPQNYELVIMDDFAIYAIPFIKQNKLNFIVSQSGFIPQEMIIEVQKNINPDDIGEVEQFLGVDFKKQEFVLSQVYADKVIIHSSKIFYEKPLNEKHRFVMNNSIVEYDQNKSLKNDKSLILISLGTIFNNNTEFFNLLINYFANANHQVIVTLGNNKELYHLLKEKYKFNNIQIELWVDQKEILKKTSLFITHSGYNGIKESIQSNTPMITVPQNADQPLISKRLEQLGVALELKEYSNEQLDLIYKQIKENYQEFQNKLKIVQESFQHTMNTEQFVEQQLSKREQEQLEVKIIHKLHSNLKMQDFNHKSSKMKTKKFFQIQKIDIINNSKFRCLIQNFRFSKNQQNYQQLLYNINHFTKQVRIHPIHIHICTQTWRYACVTLMVTLRKRYLVETQNWWQFLKISSKKITLISRISKFEENQKT